MSKEAVSITNTTKRAIRLGGTVVIAPGQTMNLARDAQRMLKRPLLQSYISGGDIAVKRAAVKSNAAPAAPAAPASKEDKKK